jgi:hypothetical protein
MTDDPSRSTDANRSDDQPLWQSRRLLLRLLGSATAVGAVSGLAVAGDDDHDETDDDDAEIDKPELANLLHLDGLELREHEVRVDSLRATPTIDGESTEAFAIDGFRATIEDDTVTGTDVDSVEIHEDVESKVVWLLDHLADGTMPDDLDHVPDWLHEHLLEIDTKYFEYLETDVAKRDGPADALEYYLEHGGKMTGNLLLLAALLLFGLVVIAILFLLR